MPVSKPYKRNTRIFTDGEFQEGGRWKYITHKKYASSPEQYIRAYLLIQKDLRELFDYIEPSDKNLDTYSYRVHELLLRTCVEVEANFKAILRENRYTSKKEKNWNMTDYEKINITHRLSSYEVKLPIWEGEHDIRKPFLSWKEGDVLGWYDKYNIRKHNRHTKFKNAAFDTLVDAVCGLVALLTSQFLNNDFSSSNVLLASGGRHDDGMESAIGDYFRVKYPTDWGKDKKYKFEWQKIKSEEDPFDQIDYDQI